MSLFSFIFFPRELDENRLHEIISDKLYDYDSLNKFHFFHQEHLDGLSDIIGKRMFSGIYISKEPDLKFKGTFHNKFCYLMDNYLYYDPERIEAIQKYIDCKDTHNQLSQLDLTILLKSRLNRHQLFTIIDENIKKGEFVEIYNEVLHDDWKYIWGPPKETVELSLNDILSERKFNLCDSRWKKYIIYK